MFRHIAKQVLIWLIAIGALCIIPLALPGILFPIIMSFRSTAYEEMLRAPSPDLKVDAVLIRTGSGAPGSFGYKIFIVPRAAEWKKDTESFDADHVCKVKFYWRQSGLLEIQYERARIYRFSNFWQSKEIDDGKYVVELRLTPNSSDFSLSPSDRWLEKDTDKGCFIEVGYLYPKQYGKIS